MIDFITCDLSELEEEVLISISDEDLTLLIARFAGYTFYHELEDDSAGNTWRVWIICNPDREYSPDWGVADPVEYLPEWVTDEAVAKTLFTGVEGFELEQITTSAGLPLWKAVVPTLPGFNCREFDIEPARAVAKLYVREKISTPRLKVYLEEKGFL